MEKPCAKQHHVTLSQAPLRVMNLVWVRGVEHPWRIWARQQPAKQQECLRIVAKLGAAYFQVSDGSARHANQLPHVQEEASGDRAGRERQLVVVRRGTFIREISHHPGGLLLPGEAVVRMDALPERLTEIFLEDSENDVTFHGFSDSEISDKNSSFQDEAKPEISPKKASSQLSAAAAAKPFRLQVALHSRKMDDDEMESPEKAKSRAETMGLKRTRRRTTKERCVKFEDEETAASRSSPPEECGSDSADDVSDSFLAKREQNIEANKAMLAQLMADLQKMPGGGGLLKRQADKQKTNNSSSRRPRSRELSRRNPEQASRRQTRSMGISEDLSEKAEVEITLEEELMVVHKVPYNRGIARPKPNKPHIIRPVEEITQDELDLVAETMVDKVYNTVTGSTCHQCRQKTVDTKTCCRSMDCRGIQGQFCGPCLRNRYGEDVRKALLDPEWKCPPCRGICNCSFCRQREGRCPTGILFPLAQYHGFPDVHSYLCR
ncbi:cell division cycle-associated 7-like protein [Pholidichthys leucotaenia]